jgi:hypothetical protein
MKRTSIAFWRAATARAGLVCGLVLLPGGAALAQTPRPEGSTALPPVEVNPPQQRATRVSTPARPQRTAGPRQGTTAPAC